MRLENQNVYRVRWRTVFARVPKVRACRNIFTTHVSRQSRAGDAHIYAASYCRNVKSAQDRDWYSNSPPIAPLPRHDNGGLFNFFAQLCFLFVWLFSCFMIQEAAIEPKRRDQRKVEEVWFKGSKQAQEGVAIAQF